jgi:lipoprotein-anchoring transpeptidase ErfK/SrfK
MNMIDSMSEKRDVPITLNSVSMEDTYEGGFEDNRIIEYTLDFTMKVYFFGPVYTGEVIKSVIERDYVNIDAGGFTTSQIDASGLVKEVKHYEPAFGEVADAVSNSTNVSFGTAINSKISVGDEVFGTNLDTNPTVTAVGSDKLTVTLSSAITIDADTTLKFVGSVDPSDTFVVAETVTFYDDGVDSTFAEDKVTDAS